MPRMIKVYSLALLMTVAGAIVALNPSPVLAQGTTPPLASQPAQLDITLTRYQGDKKIGTAPFVVMLNAARNVPYTTVESGLDIPIGTSNSDTTQTSGAQGNSPRAVRTQKVETTYRTVGTRISCSVSRADESTYVVYLDVRDSRVLERDIARRVSAATTANLFRTLSHTSSLQMKEGETKLFAVLADQASGETVKIDVKLTILK